MRHDETGGWLLLTEMVTRVYEALTVKPGRTIVAPGQSVAWDDCCEGQLWSRVVSASPLYQGTGNSVKCPIGYDLTLGVGIIRCVSTVDDRGRAPKAAKITDDGQRGLRDMSQIAGVLQDFTAPDILTSRLGIWTPAGPDGGCAGGEWTFTARVGAEL